MSNIYIQEPPTLGKVLMHTTVGDIDVELWSREAPRACRNFIQLCLEGYYNDTIFHRLVKGFIVQGGDPTGTGEGGESIYGAPFKDEFHTRLRFNRRGLLAMANAGKDDNGSQFFFTLGPAPELQNKHTIFGKVAGDTVYNMLKLAEGLVDHDERPLYPYKIISTEVLSNPFPDIELRIPAKSAEDEAKARKQKKKDKRAAVKDFKLLSFGSEAEDDEAECEEVSKRLAAGRSSKSAHDVLSDPLLSSAPAVGTDEEALSGDEDEPIGPIPPVDTNNIRNKLQKKIDSKPSSESHKVKKNEDHDKVSEKEEVPEDSSPVHETQAEQLKRLREEYKALRAQLRKVQNKDNDASSSHDQSDSNKDQKKKDSEIVNEFEAQREKYRNMQKEIPKKGASREDFTLQLLAKFQKKLASAKESVEADEEDPEKAVEQKLKEDPNDEDSGWMTHKLQFDKGDPVLAKDASTKDDDWFEIYDPRNPITKRRREAGRDPKGSHDGGKFREKPRERR
ncbi:Peptidyl-prolyl cis-trans isomerase [Gryllus bimaculatus]|nr:Peptidyl-prolyl cis-trans isomerase [Gryllus bimaculatus]